MPRGPEGVGGVSSSRFGASSPTTLSSRSARCGSSRIACSKASRQVSSQALDAGVLRRRSVTAVTYEWNVRDDRPLDEPPRPVARPAFPGTTIASCAPAARVSPQARRAAARRLLTRSGSTSTPRACFGAGGKEALVSKVGAGRLFAGGNGRTSRDTASTREIGICLERDVVGEGDRSLAGEDVDPGAGLAREILRPGDARRAGHGERVARRSRERRVDVGDVGRLAREGERLEARAERRAAPAARVGEDRRLPRSLCSVKRPPAYHSPTHTSGRPAAAGAGRCVARAERTDARS